MKPSALFQQREEKVLLHCARIMSLVPSAAWPAPSADRGTVLSSLLASKIGGGVLWEGP